MIFIFQALKINYIHKKGVEKTSYTISHLNNEHYFIKNYVIKTTLDDYFFLIPNKRA